MRFPETPALQTGVLWLCISVVLKARVCASLSSYPSVSLSCTLFPGPPTPVELPPAEPLPPEDPAGRALVQDIALARQPLPLTLA